MIINSSNSWSLLKEVWLGDVYPADWYDHLPTQVRDAFRTITEITKEDLDIIQTTIESFGVHVRRPTYDNIDSFIDAHTKQLMKPQITPRDQFVTLGNKLIAHRWHTKAWESVLEEYKRDTECSVILTDNVALNGANVVRMNKDIIIDTPDGEQMNNDFLLDYNVTIVNNGGHMDGCFAILKPGLLIASNYFPSYDETFPGWTKIDLSNPEFKQQGNAHNGKWWLPDVNINDNKSFGKHIEQHAVDWVGEYTETYFELNCLVIDEQNVIMLGSNKNLEIQLAKHDIQVHWVPFRTRSFWDGGMHCLTVDIHRR
tara:strand:- start:472 stop:1410 length:939 start_codon:yes stop_codon:yes gene_type:complete